MAVLMSAEEGGRKPEIIKSLAGEEDPSKALKWHFFIPSQENFIFAERKILFCKNMSVIRTPDRQYSL